jgi:hypothetical protein
MARNLRTILLALARVWAYPLWCSVTRSESADAFAEELRLIAVAEIRSGSNPAIVVSMALGWWMRSHAWVCRPQA